MIEEIIDENNESFKNFVECYNLGASKQDIYDGKNKGFSISKRSDANTPELKRRRYRMALEEFKKIYGHKRYLVNPIDKHYGIKGKNILEFGCGTGALSVALALKGAKVTGVDPSELQIEACKHRANYFKIKDENFKPILVSQKPELGFDKKTFDMVITNSLSEFIPENMDKYIKDLISFVRDEGLFVVSTENGFFPIDYYTGMLFPLFRREKCIRESMPYGMTYLELSKWVKDSGRKLKDLSIENKFNSIDKRLDLLKENEKNILPLDILNKSFKYVCRSLSIPSDIFFPYTTFIFKLKK